MSKSWRYLQQYRAEWKAEGRSRTYNHIIVAGVGDDLRRLGKDGLLAAAGIALER